MGLNKKNFLLVLKVLNNSFKSVLFFKRRKFLQNFIRSFKIHTIKKISFLIILRISRNSFRDLGAVFMNLKKHKILNKLLEFYKIKQNNDLHLFNCDLFICKQKQLKRFYLDKLICVFLFEPSMLYFIVRIMS